MVGIVVVSHSDILADAVVTLAREMAPPELALEAAGGIGEPGVLGTSAEVVRAAIERAMSPDGVLVVMDLGSALMSAELAVELLEHATGPVRLSDAPLVEGAVAAVAAAGGGASLDEVAAEARRALAMKTTQIGSDAGSAASAPAATADAEVAKPYDETAGTPAGVEARLPVRNEVGLHARPAARLVQTVTSYDADVRVARDGSGTAPVSARSLTNIVTLGARQGDTLIVRASGPQALAAVDALERLAAAGFGDGLPDGAVAPTSAARPPAADTPPSAARPPAADAPPSAAAPPSAPPAGAILRGIAVSSGTAAGPAHLLADVDSPPPPRDPGTPEAELALLDSAIAATGRALAQDRAKLAERGSHDDSEIFDAHLALLGDDVILGPARTAIGHGVTAEQAYHDAIRETAAVYRELPDRLLAQRAIDVVDLGRRVVNSLTGEGAPSAPATGVVIADELTPAQTVALEPDRVAAIVTARGSATAHAAIIARGLGLPAVVGAGPAVLAIEPGTPLLVDGDAGTVQVDPSKAELAAAGKRGERRRTQAAAALADAREPARLASGEQIEIAANIGGTDDARRAVDLGADGVGLLRTEFLFLDRAELPDEEEQVDTLRRIAVVLDGRPLIVRTLDAGADKPLPGLPMPSEANPFLGVRGIRVGLANPAVLSTQLRAILRVAAEYPLKLMLPMVSTLDEVDNARALLTRARASTGVSAPAEFGIMVEVPAAAIGAAELAAQVDFFSIGTNDLTQYTMAAERGDPRLAPLLATPQPAVLRLIQTTVAAATQQGRWVGVCGEMAGDPSAAVLLVGLGVTELSMSPLLIPDMKAALRRVTLDQASEVASAALNARSAEAARTLGHGLLL